MALTYPRYNRSEKIQRLLPIKYWKVISWTDSKITFFGFDGNLSNTPIEIGSYENVIDLENGTIIAQLNETPLLYRGSNYLILTLKPNDFGVTVNDVAKRNCDRRNIWAVD